MGGHIGLSLGSSYNFKAGSVVGYSGHGQGVGHASILVNALTPGSIITQERIDQFNDGTFGTADMPEGAVQTREKMQAAIKRADLPRC